MGTRIGPEQCTQRRGPKRAAACNLHAGGLEAIHCFCGELCGQAPVRRPRDHGFRGRAWNAQNLGKKKSLEIKYLHSVCGALAGNMVNSPSVVAAVEFSGRANAAFGDG
jgi:hypothetical protein